MYGHKLFIGYKISYMKSSNINEEIHERCVVTTGEISNE